MKKTQKQEKQPEQNEPEDVALTKLRNDLCKAINVESNVQKDNVDKYTTEKDIMTQFAKYQRAYIDLSDAITCLDDYRHEVIECLATLTAKLKMITTTNETDNKGEEPDATNEDDISEEDIPPVAVAVAKVKKAVTKKPTKAEEVEEVEEEVPKKAPTKPASKKTAAKKTAEETEEAKEEPIKKVKSKK